MKHLLPLVLACLLLCGCGRNASPEETTPLPATAPAAVSEGMYEPEQYQGALQVCPLDIRKVQGMRAMGDSLLLFSGQGSTTLTLLTGDDLTAAASAELDFQLAPDDPSLRFHDGPTLSFYDPVRQETLVLDSRLQEIRRIAVPGDLTGTPVLSDDGNTLYYCTVSEVRAWDLESGIRRRVKEMRFDSQTVVNVLIGGSVLQCRVVDGRSERTLFLSSENGRLLEEGKGDFSILSEGDRYYAAVPAGSVRVLVFGAESGVPQTLIPTDIGAEGFFLPRLNGLVTASGDAQVQLEYYDLNTGLRRAVLTLGSFHYPTSVESTGGNAVYILTYNPAEDRNILYRWNVGSTAPLQDDACYTEPYYTAEKPDSRGLAECQAYADRIGQKYSIDILLWEDAAAAEPWDYDFEAEHLVPVIRQDLEELEQRLAQYPEDMLAQTASHFTSLKLCLVRSLTGTAGSGSLSTATGVQFLDGSDAYVVIATGEFSGQALYHELFHVMETHIFSESIAFDQWDTLNPAGFQYDYDYAANAIRDSGVYLLAENRAFVDTYSMSFPKEDRARIMEYAMLPGNEDLFRPERMQAKLKTLCGGIREAYGLEDSEETFLWEQYLE